MRIEHACLHSRLRDADDLGDFLHRLLVVVHEVDDLPVVRRKPGQALPQGRAFLFLRQGGFGIVVILNLLCRFVVQFFLGRRRRAPTGP